jgi:hypothetical protein
VSTVLQLHMPEPMEPMHCAPEHILSAFERCSQLQSVPSMHFIVHVTTTCLHSDWSNRHGAA